mgnify:CR=1 FL=1
MAINDNNAANFPVGIPLGVSGTTNQSYGQNGSLKDILSITSGSADSADKAMAFANQFAPLAPKADPWEAAFQFFAEMGRQASVPGSTALGAAVGSLQAPMDYLTAKKKELRDSEAARTQMALTVGAGLKEPTGKVTYRLATAKELEEYGATAGQMGSDGKFYDLSKKSDSGTNNTGSYVFQNSAAFDLFKIEFPKMAERLTEGQIAGTEPLIINKSLLTDPKLPNVFKDYEPPSSPSDGGPATSIAKLFDDLGKAKNEVKSNAKQFLVENPDATPEEILGASEADLSTLEVMALEKQIEEADFNKDIFSSEKGLRSEWTKVSVPFEKVEGNHKKLKAALEKQTGVGDMSAIFVYMKMLDPGSVVRESEFSAAQQTAGIMQQVQILGNQLLKGDKLSPEQRTEFLDLAEVFFKVTKDYTTQKRVNLQAILENTPLLKFSNVFGFQYPFPKFYLDPDNIRIIENSTTNLTMQKIWDEMTTEEKREYQ